MEKLAEWKIIAEVRIMGGMAATTPPRDRKSRTQHAHGFVLFCKGFGSPDWTDSRNIYQSFSLGKRGTLLFYYHTNVCATDKAVAIHIRAEVRAVDLLAL